MNKESALSLAKNDLQLLCSQKLGSPMQSENDVISSCIYYCEASPCCPSPASLSQTRENKKNIESHFSFYEVEFINSLLIGGTRELGSHE